MIASDSAIRIDRTTSPLYVHSPDLALLPWLRHGCTTRLLSPVRRERIDDVRCFQDALGLPPLPIVFANQKHTNHVHTISPEETNSTLSPFVHDATDGFVCTQAGVTVAVFTADCCPVFIVDTRTKAFALVHAGWKGTFSRIVEEAVRQLHSLGSTTEDLLAWIGPAIGPCCYEVSEEMIADFTREFADASAAGIDFSNGRLLDLTGLNRYQLEHAGLLRDRITLSGVCTQHSSTEFFSYRADGPRAGRIISLITVIPDVS